ncbi:unnamed protein product [Euphydryas editha]|uniref:Reverse transcriptase n=1 Tax=Euphydryas editha TaxID=104508 RepID=A0AAU9U8X0_EUPED|nr:unnamed protein product [Euphydryas editha]
MVDRITEHILKGFAISKSYTTDSLFFDVAKAFDKVWHNGLVYKLYQDGLPDKLMCIIRVELTCRIALSDIVSKDTLVISTNPCQIFTEFRALPTLFSVYKNYIPIPAKREATKLTLFIDETAKFTTATSMETMTRRLQSATTAPGDLFRKCGIDFNADKTAAEHFFKHQNHVLWAQAQHRSNGKMRSNTWVLLSTVSSHFDHTLTAYAA